MGRNLRLVVAVITILAVVPVFAAGFASASTKPAASAPQMDRCIGRCAAACQQMAIWYLYRRYGKEDLYLRKHDITKPPSGPVSVDAINRALADARIPIHYAQYKAEYDPQNNTMLPVHWLQIIDSLLAGRPVIYYSDITDGPDKNTTHAFLLVGYNSKTGLFYANDTYFKRVPIGKDKQGHLIWSKDKRFPVKIQVLGNASNPVWMTQENLDKHKRPNAEGCIFYYSPVEKESAVK